MGRRWSTITEAAEYFTISKKTLYSLIGRNRLPSGSVLRIGRQIRIDVSKVEQAAEGIGKCR